MRYQKVNLVWDFYDSEFYRGGGLKCFEDKYGRKEDAYAAKIAELKSQGWTENVAASEVTGGDNDFLILDHKRKEFCWWEYGFGPFCSSEIVGDGGDLELIASNRK